MTTTTKPVYRWDDILGGHILRSEPDGYGVAEVMPVHNGNRWAWKSFGSNKLSDAFPTAAAAKAACEKALGITTEPEGAKGQEDQPKVLPFYWDHIRDNLSALNGTNGSRLAIVNFYGAWNHWFWNPVGDPEGVPFSRTFKTEGEAKSSCEQFFYANAKDVQADRLPVVVPPNGLADALDAHAAKVAEEDAEARHAEAMARPERPRGHASQPAAERAREIVHGRNGVYGKPERSQERIAAMWSAYLGTEVTAQQVCGCMALLKMARLAESPGHVDSLVDAHGYLMLYETCGLPKVETKNGKAGA